METAPSASPARPIPGFSLLGKRAFVTGGSRGIGRAYGRDAGGGRRGRGGRAPARPAPSRRRRSAPRSANWAGGPAPTRSTCRCAARSRPCATASSNDFDGIDILVNNAGVTRDRPFRKMDRETWDTVINTNLNSVFDITQRFIEGMAGPRLGTGHQHLEHRRPHRQLRPDQLRRRQGRPDRVHQGAGPGIRQPRRHGERHRPGLREDPDAGGRPRQGAAVGPGRHAGGPTGRPDGDRLERRSTSPPPPPASSPVTCST